MKLFSLQKNALLLMLSTNLLAANTSNADLASSSLLWKRSISHVYVCSETKEISSVNLEDFYAAIPQVSAQFNDGWKQAHDEQTHNGDIVIVSIAPQEYSSNLENCLKGIAFFQTQWIEDITQQASEIGTVPEYLANTPLGKHYEPLNASWVYRYGDGVVFSSYIYQSTEHFSYDDAVWGALQFQGQSKTNTENSGDD
jgi:hypothetical protein